MVMADWTRGGAGVEIDALIGFFVSIMVEELCRISPMGQESSLPASRKECSRRTDRCSDQLIDPVSMKAYSSIQTTIHQRRSAYQIHR
jgi:hypothetical protein